MPENGKKAIRILHSGDLHLDSPFSGLDIKHSEIRRAEQRGMFTAMTQFVRSRKVDIMLLPGDLFDDGFASPQTVEILLREFANTPDCRFFISPGNHDPYTKNSVYAAKKFPPNVHIFDNETLECVTLPELGIDIYGWGFCGERFEGANPLIDRRAADDGRFTVLSAHCDLLSPLSPYCPVSESDIAAFGADYAALAHVHRDSGMHSVGGHYYAYSGCPEGRSFDEPGEGGAYYIELSYKGEEKVFTYEKVRFSRRSYQTEHIDVTGASTLDDIRAALSARIAEKHYGEETILRVYFEGATAPSLERLASIEGEYTNLFSLQIHDRTLPLFDSEYLKTDMTVRGALYRVLLPKLESGSAEERALAASAFKYALAAIDGGDLSAI